MEKLPVEIVHRIFDHLDIETIFFSLRPVSRSFRSIVLNYNRWDFHLKISSKVQFDVLCQLLPPENIRSLTLYNNEHIPDQISSFLQQVHLGQLTRLHSIHLDGINEFQLNYFYQRINLNLLRSFSIRMTDYDDKRRKEMVNYLSTIVSQANLRHIYLNMNNNRISNLSWAMNCSIECLTVRACIKFDNLVKIFSCSPQLHRLILKETFFGIGTNNRTGHSFPQLKSLIIEKDHSRIDALELFLCLTPSLSHLKLLGRRSEFDGKRWEEFVQVNLLHLNQFQFDVQCWQWGMIERTRGDFERIMKSFRSPFWLEDKKWFVQCQWHSFYGYEYELYSIPMCKSSLEIDLSLNREIISTSNEKIQATSVTEIIVRLGNDLIESRLTSMNILYFPNVTKLHLDFNGKISINSLNLSRVINLSQLVEVQLDCHHLDSKYIDIFFDIFTLFKQSSELRKLIIRNISHQRDTYPYLKRILGRLPSQIKCFQIPINDVEIIPMIAENCRQLRVLQLPKKSVLFSRKIREWFERNTIGSIISQSDEYDTIWVGKFRQTIQSNPKRIKLNE